MLRPHAREHALVLTGDRLSAQRRVAARIADALQRGDKVIHVHLGDAADAEPGLLRLLPGGVAGHEQLELVSVADERERTGGTPDAALAAQAARIDRARDEGFPGVTCTADDGAWLELVDDVVAFEHGLNELAAQPGTTVLCAYALDALRSFGTDLDTALAGVHYGKVDDEHWSVTMRGTMISLAGELDETNADRVRAVVVGALEESVNTLDLHGVTYLSSEAVRAIEDAADRAFAADLQLRLIRIPAIVRRAFDAAGFTERAGVSMPPLQLITPIAGTREESLRVANVFQTLAQLEEATSEAEATVGLAGTLAQVIARAAHVSVTIGPPASPVALDSNSVFAQQMDGLQMQAGEGPCQSAWDSRTLVLTADLREDPRWPELTRLAGPTDLASVLALPVRAVDDVVGVVNAYSTETDAFAGIDIDMAEMAAFAVGQVFQRIESTRALRDMVTNLRQALSSRSVIDQAKGILMARHGYDEDTAFTRLSEISQRENIKVRDLAVLLTEEVQRREQ
jgi:anti-anti-sigma factor